MTAPALALDFDAGRDPAELAAEALHHATAVYTRDAADAGPGNAVDLILDNAGWTRGGAAGRGALLDVGAGGGVFLCAAVSRLLLAPNDVDGLAARVQGWEIFPGAVAAARARLAGDLIARGWYRAAAEAAAARVFLCRDFLAPGPAPRSFNLTVGNPPFCRAANLPPLLQARYRASVPDFARADVLHACIHRAAEALCDGGVMSFVTADTWLLNDTAGRLRAHVGERFGIVRTARLDSASTFHRPKNRRRAGELPRVHAVAVLLSADARDTHPLTHAPVYPGAPFVPAPGVVRLDSLARVFLGPYLGRRGALVLPRAEADARGIPPTAYAPCVDTDEIRTDDTLRPLTRVVLATRRTARPHSAVLAYLAERTGVPVDALSPDHWAPEENWVGRLPLPVDALLVPRIADRLRAIRLPAGAVAINHGLTIATARPGVDLDALAAAITGPEAQRWMRHHCKRLENGYYSITTRRLHELLVVPPR